MKTKTLNLLILLLALLIIIKIMEDMKEQTKANQMHNATMQSAFSSIIRVNNQSVNYVPTLNNLP
jgi:hypothetical protein